MTSKLRAIAVCALLLPLDLVVALALLIAAGIQLVERGLKPATTGTIDVPGKSVVAGFSPRPLSIVIVNWDGKHLLAECLPALIDAIHHDGGNHEILVVDNGSTDGSTDFIRQHFPQVRILALDKNYGFGEGNNRATHHSHADIVVFLNNDMIVDRDFLRPLLAGFSDPSVFAVTSQIFFEDPAKRREETGLTKARFEHGLFYLWHADVAACENATATVPVFWAGGGSCAVDRKKFLQLGGFDPLYRPFYVEDADLSYQAWKRGWKSVLAPASHVIHKHRGTSRPRFGERFVENTIRKNQYLFVWKNVTDFSMLLQHLANLPRIHGRAILQYGAAFEMQAYVRAMRQLPEAFRKRLANLRDYVVSDQDVLVRSQNRCGGTG